MPDFRVVSEFQPAGDQPRAVEEIVRHFRNGARNVTLLGVTGSGKTATASWVIEQMQKPTLVIAPNKTLAAQLCAEFKEFFPNNAVEYFVSYYDYYQPEAYIPQTDTYIEKDAERNEEIDKLRHSATSALFERRDVIIVASVSCIYGLGSPEDYRDLVLSLRVGMRRPRAEILRKLVDIQYERNDVNFVRGRFRVRGDVIEVFPVGESERAIRIELFGDEVERITEIDTLTGEVLGRRDHVAIYPASHYVTQRETMLRAIASIEEELQERLAELRAQDKLLEAQRLEQRTRYDLEMMQELGFCNGIENYSRHLTGRRPGEPPYTLLDFFPDDFLVIIDESHVTIPQIAGMYPGDRSRKESLVEHGFRLPSALDNRPLTFEEFTARVGQALFISATPGPYEEKHSDHIVEQIVRPTGLIDPEVVVRPTHGQIDDLIGEIRQRARRNQRVLVTTLTKKMAEELTDYLRENGLRVRYMHSEIDALERMEIIRDLRLGRFDVLVGINLLREGLDLPEVSLVAILDADKEGYLRSARSLIQTIGRAARNVDGRVIMYADTITGSMRQAIDETNRRRYIQAEFNRRHGITPRSVVKKVRDVIEATHVAEKGDEYWAERSFGGWHRLQEIPERQIPQMVARLRKEMQEAARQLEFERAALLRDMIIELEGRVGERRRRGAVRAAPVSEIRDRYWTVLMGQRRLAVHGLEAGPEGGRPALLLHGFGGSALYWRKTIQFLAGAPLAYRVYALDLPGFGLSDPLAAEAPFGAFADCLEAWLADAVEGDEGSWLIVGHSMGGMVAIDFAARYPSRVGGLVLVASAGLHRESYDRLLVGTPRVPLLRRALAWLFSTHTFGRLAFRHLTYRPLEELPPDILSDLQWGFRRCRALEYLPRFYRFPDFLEKASQIRAPALVVSGRQDTVVPLHFSRRLQSALPDARLVLFDACGHMPMLEWPEQFHEELAAFLDAVASPLRAL